MTKRLLTLVLFTNLTAHASDFSLGTFNYSDFVAPSVSAEGDVTDKRIGMIIFDNSTNQFKGLNKDGDWNPMTTPAGNALVSGVVTSELKLQF